MKRMIFAVMLLVSAQAASAQYYETDSAKGFDPSRVMIGGSVGFSFGDYTFVNISPLIGYRFSPKFAAGVNINAQYASQRLKDNTGFTYERNNYSMIGAGVFGRFYPFEQFFLHAQPEYNSITMKRSERAKPPVRWWLCPTHRRKFSFDHHDPVRCTAGQELSLYEPPCYLRRY
jgi:hypothetical protein